MRKFGSILFSAVLAILPGAPLTAPPAAAQETAQEREDRGYLAGLLEDNLSGAGRQVVIDGFKGALSSQATIDRLTIADDQGVWLTLNNVRLDWNRSALLTGRVSVNELAADEIILDRLPQSSDTTAPSPEATPFSLPELPVSVQIGKLSAPKITLGPTILGEPVEARLEAQVSLAGGEGQVSLILERSDSGPSGRVQLAGSYANSSRQLILDLVAAEGAGGIASRLMGLPGTPAVELAVKGSGAIENFTATVNLTSDGQPRLSGAVSLRAAQDGAQGFAVNLGGDLAPLFLPDYATFFGNNVSLVASGARTAAGVTELQSLDLRTQALNVQGSAAIAADGMPEILDLTMQIAQQDGSAVLLPIAGADRVYLDRADLALKFDSADDAGWRASGRLTGLKQAALTAEKIEFAGSGRILRANTGNVVGGTLRYGVHALDLADPAIAQAAGRWMNGHVLFNWQQGGTGLRLPDIVVRGDGYRLQGGVTLAGLGGAMSVMVRANADVDDMARFSAITGQALGGSGAIAINGTGNPLTGAFDGQVNVNGQDLTAGIAQVDNLLRGTSTVLLSARRDETGTVLRQLDVVAQTLHLTGSGTVATAGSDIGADLAFSDLSVLGAGYGGSLTGRLRVQGTGQNATLTLDAVGGELAIDQPQADALLRGQSILGVTVVKTGDDLRIERASVANPQVSAQATGQVTGPQRQMDLSATAAIANLSVIPGYRGAVNAEAKLTGTVEDGQIVLDATGTNLAIGQTQADRLLAGDSRISADLALKGGAIKINKATVRNPQLSLDATGQIEGDTRSVDLDARLANLAILQPEFPGPVTVKGTAVDAPGGMRLDFAAQGPGQINGRLSGTVAPGFGSADLTIQGTGQAALVNAFLDPRALSGGVSYDLRLNGPLRLSSLSGRVSLTDARLVDPDLTFAIRGLSATANLSGGRATVQANAEVSTGGHLRVEGNIGLEAPYDSDLRANASWVRLRDPSLYEVRANGDITLRGPLTGGANIAGRIDLVETELRIPSTGFGGIGALPDLRHFNEPKPVRDTRRRAGADAQATAGTQGVGGRPFGLDILVSAPNRLFIRGRGLDAELGGELRLTGTTANVVPVGGFELIRGRLDILGKRLELTEATLRMQGDFVPDMSIAATSESDGIAASVMITGRADDPQVSFTSTPELPQEEVLARLLFDKGLENISALQAAQLAGAVMTLAGRGGEGILGRLRSGFGLDNFDVQTTEEGGASVTAGKYLSKNLYTEVGVDNAGESEIQLNLDVSKSVTVRARTGSDGDSGLGIYYQRDY